ncbi:MAG: 3'-5' exonuclease [Acholeplasmatales bacterium]|nr:3'-5' exonuclease [Acholeplasmatales bacterium]
MKLIVIDIETTGLDISKDEILQISIIDGNYNTLLNKYCKPEHITSWEEAEAVHSITPEMVENKSHFQTYVNKVQELISTAERILVYNGLDFDLKMLEKYGIHIEYTKNFDLMLEVDKVYRKWFKLVDLARYYGYEFKAHDSLEDTKATLYCYYKFKKELSNKFFDNKSIDFIIQYSKKEEQAKTVGSPVLFNSEHIGRYVLVRSGIKSYYQNLLFNNKNQLVDSHCTCLDCLDGGNRICKHVVATLLYLKNNIPDIYQESLEKQNAILRIKKGRKDNGN